MTPYPQGDPDICNNNTLSTSSNDYIIHTSSIRLPFIAAGLVNAAVANLLNELSCRFFEMAIITPKINDETKKLTEYEKLENNSIPLKTMNSSNDVSIFSSQTQITTDNMELEKATEKKMTMDINQVIPSDEHMLTSQSIHENIFTTSITSSISTNRLLDNSLTSSNFHTEPIKIKEESQVDFPDNDDDDNNNNIIDNSNNYITTTQHTNNFLNNQISEQYHEQNENHLSGNELQSNLTRLTTIDYLKRHPCTYRGCNKVFFSRTSLIYHKQSHSIDKPYICKYTDCGITFSNETLLKTHNQLHESKQLRERFSCSLSECNKVFVTRESLIEHIRIHTGEKPFICDYPGCTHRFARRCNLFAHKRVHLDKNQRRQYHCIHPGCCKTFLYSRSLTEHMNVHLGERPYVCDYSGCEKSFTSKSYLYAHRRIHLGGGSGGGSGVDKSTNSMCSQSSISRQYDSGNNNNNNNNIPPIPVTVTIPVLQPMHYPFNQSIIPNKQQQQQHQQTQLQQHPVLSNTNMNMTNHLPAHLFYPNQHN